MKALTIPPTAQRVKMNTNEKINAKIAQKTQANIKRYVGLKKQDLTKRIEELDKEWDTERTLETNFAILGLFTAILGFTLNKKRFALGGIASAFLLQHALQGWCPPLSIIRRLGIRTAEEINMEKNVLKALRGDIKLS